MSSKRAGGGGLTASMATPKSKEDPVRQQLIQALFSDSSSSTSETMLTYIKIYEEEKANKDTKILPTGKKDSGAERAKMLSKPRYLCMTVKANGKVRLHKVKKTSATSFHIGRTWHLDEIKSIENVDGRRWTVVINRPYAWVADTSELKNDFLMMLLKVLRSNLKKLPALINIDEPAITTQFNVTREANTPMSSRISRATPISNNNSSGSLSTSTGSFVQDFENRLSIQTERMKRNAAPLTPSLGSAIAPAGSAGPTGERNGAKFMDETDPLDEVALMNLEELLYDMDLASSEDGVALETRLMKELNSLEMANIYSIIESDDRIKDVMAELDKGIEELDDMDSWLSLYRQELDSMGDDIRQIESQNRGLQVQTSNQASLLRELENLLFSITIPDRILETLKKESLEREAGIRKIEEAAAEIQSVLLAKYDEDVAGMSAVRGRMELYNFHCESFAGRLADFLKNKLQTQTDQLLGDKQRTLSKGYVVMFGYEPMESYFISYRGLILWLKEMDPTRRFTELQMHLVNNLNRLVRKELKEFFNVLYTHHVAKLEKPDDSEFVFGSTHHGGLISRGGTAIRESLSSPSDLTGRIPWRKRSTRDIHEMTTPDRNSTLYESSRRIDVGPEEKLAVDDAFAQALTIVTAVAARGQNYMSDLFTLTKMMSLKMFLNDTPPFSLQELDSKRKTAMDVKSSKRLTQLMGILFDGLSVELNNLADNGFKNESVQCVGMLISVERVQKQFADSDQAFLITMLTQLHTKLVGMFEKYVEEQLKFIEEARNKTKRKGVLPFMRIFPRFAEKMEALLDGDNDIEARKMITSAYDKLVRVMFESTEAVAKETVDSDDKEQGSHVVNIENMHHFYSEIRQRKIPNLENYMKYAKSSYESHLETYVRGVVRKTLLKLLDFFDGVEGLVKAKASEDVAFHLTYNKQALKKVVASYPAATIRKDLAHLYKKVEKHFSSEEEEGLLQVAWRGIQEEFIRQHERFSRLINECYPDAGVQMEFSMNELLGFFSDIAKSHH
ncbi:hypothetical protein BGX21_000657 [Mortierella sp. AD011]|nr:hypothetical protein BGX20_001207 [Mortierella sp. AD010]KAF9387055.1 hypothetical protein BGX21_000657 [Mortierella sp. AD011]